MPVLDLPPEFTVNEWRVGNQSAVATVRSNVSHCDVARVNLGVLFDSLPTYRNINESNPDIHFTLIPPSMYFDHVNPYVVFDPSTDTQLKLTVS